MCIGWQTFTKQQIIEKEDSFGLNSHRCLITLWKHGALEGISTSLGGSMNVLPQEELLEGWKNSINLLKRLVYWRYRYQIKVIRGQEKELPIPTHLLILINREWDEIFNESRVRRKPRIFSDYFPLLLEAGAVAWGPFPFRFCNSWMLIKDCSTLIKQTLSVEQSNGWAGFIIRFHN